MSTAMRRHRPQALALVSDFEALIRPALTCERWEVAGSIRRLKPDVGDIDIVACPRFEDLPAADMFATPTLTNLLWRRVDDLVASGEFARHLKDTIAGPRTKWGDKARAIEFRGCCFDLQLADRDNFGVWLAIRTGPAELSKELVTRLPRGYGFDGSFHVVHQQSGDRLKQLTEERFFELVGLPFKAPEAR